MSLAQKLVRAGAEIQDALHEAVQDGHGGIVNDLLENGASVTAKDRLGRTPLHVAAGRGEKETVQLLLQKGADKDAQGNSRRTPLYIAVSDGHAAAAFALLAVGADVHFQCGPFQWSVVHAAAQNGLLSVLRAAIERGADLEARDNENKTACHFAAFEGKVRAINVLAEAGANVNVRTPMGERPLHLACAGRSTSRPCVPSWRMVRMSTPKIGATSTRRCTLRRTALGKHQLPRWWIFC